MSRIAKNPVVVPKGVDVSLQGNHVEVKGPKGTLSYDIHDTVDIKQENGSLVFSARKPSANAMAGTMRSLVNNMVAGVSQGFERKLELRGVGYRAQAQGKVLNLTLGFSHPVNYDIPEGVTIETPSQTEILVKGSNKQQVGQVAADIRAYRPPEPYKGKGVRYANEHVAMKEAKKK